MFLSTIILAAGKGTRMKSPLPKVLHQVAGKSLIQFSLDLSIELQSSQVIVVLSKENKSIKDSLNAKPKKLSYTIQKEQKGTGHAVKEAWNDIKKHSETTLILYGDTPFIAKNTVKRMLKKLDNGYDLVFLGFQSKKNNSYGKFKIGSKRSLLEIIESTEEGYSSELKLSNSGIILAKTKSISLLLPKLNNRNKRKEYFLTDLVTLAQKNNMSVTYLECSENECQGVNSQADLSSAEKLFQDQFRLKLMNSGVTLRAPETCFFSFDTKIAPGSIIEQNVVFGPGVKVKNNTTIKSFSHIEGAQIGKNCQIGPFARIRPETNLDNGVKVGNFVEIKNSLFASNAKASHLSYIGDSKLGKQTNIGAGTIFCNYDGRNKNKTIIGDKVFIGSNSSLIAPLKVGSEAVIAAGSIINKDVPSKSLAISRPPQQNKLNIGKKIMLEKK